MKRITLRVGDRLKVLVDHPFGAGVRKGNVVTVVGFNSGNSNDSEEGACPFIETAFGTKWYTDLQMLFHYFKKESK